MKNQQATESLIKDDIYMKTVLIVDDVAGVREVLHDFLAMQGYRIIEADNGVSALQVLETESPDLAIVDIEMPRMNGLEFAQHAAEKNPDLPVIIISAYLEKYSMEYIRSLGVKRILRKPINLVQLGEEIKQTFAEV